MISFIKSLFTDLSNQIEKMNSDLRLISVESPVAGSFRTKTIKALDDLQQEVSSVLTSYDLDMDVLIRNNIVIYNTINEKLIEIEQYRYLPLRKIGHPEVYFGRIISRIYKEIQCFQSVPFITTISNSEAYYWAYPKYNMIAVPQGEEKNLLNLSDLYHEIGHLIYQQYKAFLINKHIQEVQKYYSNECRIMSEDGHSDGYIKELRLAEAFWQDSWAEELTCDLIATYLVGPAYAWTNMKICTVSSSNGMIYKMFNDHPSDEIRMRAILKMLDLTGHKDEVQELNNAWSKFIENISNKKEDGYERVFPDEIVLSIVRNVIEGCENVGLTSYDEQLKNPISPISKILNQSWEAIRKCPDTFQVWEAEQIVQLDHD